jgi:Putative zinc-finger
MRDEMTCARAEELLSDDLEGILGEPLASELKAHLAQCPKCSALRVELAFVKEALAEYPELEPSSSLASRAAEAALRAGKVLAFKPRMADPAAAPAAPTVPSAPKLVRLPAWAQSLAAGLALITLGTLLLTSRTEAPARAASQIVSATVNTGAYLAERKDRLVEDVRVLRVVIETAFEGRVDRVNERVEDYKKLLERRKAQDPGDDESEAGAKKTNYLQRSFPNRRQVEAVTLT